MTAAGKGADGRWRSGSYEISPELLRRQTVAALGEQFPGALIWFGEATGKWWGLVPAAGGSRLVEAHQPDGLRMEITQALGWAMLGRAAPWAVRGQP